MNQTINTALRYCIFLAYIPNVQAEVHRLRYRLPEGISDVPMSRQLIDGDYRSLNRLNAYYEPALRLIRLLYEGIGGFDNSKEQNNFSKSFLFDMNVLFERVLGRFFRENITQYDLKEQVQLPVYLSEQGKTPQVIKPDYVFSKKDSSKAVEFIVDAKYVEIGENNVSNDLLYQLSVYASVCPTKRSVLLYPLHKDQQADPRTLMLKSLDSKTIQESATASLIATVKIQPIDMTKLAKLIHGDDIEERRKYAEELLLP